jgi:hypothetical protein
MTKLLEKGKKLIYLIRFFGYKKDSHFKQMEQFRKDFLNERHFFKLHLEMIKIKNKIYGESFSNSENEDSKFYLEELIKYFT